MDESGERPPLGMGVLLAAVLPGLQPTVFPVLVSTKLLLAAAREQHLLSLHRFLPVSQAKGPERVSMGELPAHPVPITGFCAQCEELPVSPCGNEEASPVVLVAAHEWPLRPELDAGGIDDVPGAGSEEDDDDAVPGIVEIHQLKLRFSDAPDLEFVRCSRQCLKGFSFKGLAYSLRHSRSAAPAKTVAGGRGSSRTRDT